MKDFSSCPELDPVLEDLRAGLILRIIADQVVDALSKFSNHDMATTDQYLADEGLIKP